MLAGTILCAISIYFLFQPSRAAGVVYFGVWSFLVYFGFTLFEIPRGAWSSELSRDYHQRSRIQTYVGMFNIAGSFIFFAVPLLLYATGITTTTAITDTALTGIAWLYTILMPAGMILAIIFVSSGAEVTAAPSTLGQLMTSLKRNKPLWHYFGIISAWGFGQGGYLSVSFIFLTYYMHLGKIYPYLMIMFFFVALVALPTWAPLTRRIGKHRTWALAMSLDVLTRPLLLLLTPGSGAAVPVMMLVALSAFLSAPCNIAPSSVLGDVIDYDILKTRANKAGNFFAINTLLIKATIALKRHRIPAAVGVRLQREARKRRHGESRSHHRVLRLARRLVSGGLDIGLEIPHRQCAAQCDQAAYRRPGNCVRGTGRITGPA